MPVQSLYDLRHSYGADHPDGLWPTGHPGIEVKVGDTGDMVGVKVSQQHRAQPVHWQPRQQRGQGGPGPGVDDADGLSGQYRDAGLCPSSRW